MNIHEFQAKQLFAQFGIPVPIGKEIRTPRAAEKWAAKLNASVYVVKAQIHAGGRGKAGGVKLTKNCAEVPGPRFRLAGLHRQHRGRHGDRGGRGQVPGEGAEGAG